MQCGFCGETLRADWRREGGWFDWKSGQTIPDGSDRPVMCLPCFRDAVNGLCQRIENSTPETLDAVFITGMATFGETSGALSWMTDVDDAEDDPDNPGVGDINWK